MGRSGKKQMRLLLFRRGMNRRLAEAGQLPIGTFQRNAGALVALVHDRCELGQAL